MRIRLGSIAILASIVWLAAAGSAAPARAGGEFRLASSAFADGAEMPQRFTGEGKDLSPPLTWSGLPAGTRELALICEDPDAPSPHPWVHWVIYRIPASRPGLREGIPDRERLDDPPGALQGLNSWPTLGYRGPLPPPGSGTHHYHFRLFALDQTIALPPKATSEGLLKAMKGHVLGETQLVGTFKR